MFLDLHKKDAFFDLCDKFGGRQPILTHPIRVELHCIKAWNSIKVWLQPENSIKYTEDAQWYGTTH